MTPIIFIFGAAHFSAAAARSGDAPFWGVVGIAAGAFLFFRGFQMLRYKRLILDTPFSKVRSASMGLVEVTGMPVGPHTIKAAITGQPCYYYRARAWQKVEKGNKTEWKLMVDESMSLPFFVEDDTGRVLVTPTGAQLDVHRDFKDEFQTSFMRAEDMMPPSVKQFLLTRGVIGDLGVRLEEHCILPGYPLYVFGTLGDNNGVQSWTPTVHMSKPGVNASSSFKFSLGMSGAGHKEVSLGFGHTSDVTVDKSGTTISNIHTGTQPPAATTMLGRAAVSHSTQAPAPRAPNMRDTQAEKWGDMMDALPVRATVTAVVPAAAVATVSKLPRVDYSGPPASANHAAMTAVAAKSLEAAPAIAPNSMAAPIRDEWDLQTRVAIAKGDRGNPFIISSRSQREVVQSLAWKSVLFIWGGPALALASLYFLLFF